MQNALRCLRYAVHSHSENPARDSSARLSVLWLRSASADPRRTKLRVLSDEPIEMKSSSDSCEPSRVMP